MQGDTKTVNEREGKASFYGALNSDEVVRPIYWHGGKSDPNYPGTDKQTADEVGRNIGEGRGGKTGRSDISKRVVTMFRDREEGARRVARARETVRKYDGSTLGFSRREDEI